MKTQEKKKAILKLKPLGDRVLIKEIDKESKEQMKSGIIIPATVNEDKGTKKGVVVAVGEGRYEEGKLVPIRLSVGDTVLFSWGDVIKIGEDEYTLVTESNVLAIVK